MLEGGLGSLSRFTNICAQAFYINTSPHGMPNAITHRPVLMAGLYKNEIENRKIMKKKNFLAVLIAAGLTFSNLSAQAQQDVSPPASPSQGEIQRPDTQERTEQHNLPAGQLDRDIDQDTLQSQRTPPPGTQIGRDFDRAQDTASLTAAAQSYVKVSQLIGHEVKDAQGQRLGKVQDLVINITSPSAPAAAIIAYGGALGIGETRVAVPLKELTWSSADKSLTMSASKEQLQSASQTRSGGWAMIGGDEWAKNVDRFYGDFQATGMAGSDRPVVIPPTQDREFVRDPSIQTDRNLQPDQDNLDSPTQRPAEGSDTDNPSDR